MDKKYQTVSDIIKERDELKAALMCANHGLSLAYDALEKHCYDEAVLHIGHHHAKASKALGLPRICG